MLVVGGGPPKRRHSKRGAFGGGSEIGHLACPRVAILEAPSELTRFTEGGSRDITDILFQSKLEINKVTCEVEEKPFMSRLTLV